MSGDADGSNDEGSHAEPGGSPGRRWLTPGVGGIEAASFFSDAGPRGHRCGAAQLSDHHVGRASAGAWG
jgi:hypothetical protein